MPLTLDFLKLSALFEHLSNSSSVCKIEKRAQNQTKCASLVIKENLDIFQHNALFHWSVLNFMVPDGQSEALTSRTHVLHSFPLCDISTPIQCKVVASRNDVKSVSRWLYHQHNEHTISFVVFPITVNATRDLKYFDPKQQQKQRKLDFEYKLVTTPLSTNAHWLYRYESNF